MTDEFEIREDDPKYATVTMRAEALRSMFKAWVESLDVDLKETDPDEYDRPDGAWLGEEPAAAAAWFRTQAANSGVENLEPLPDAEEDDS